MRRIFLAPLAIFFERDFALHLTDILACPIVESFADGALETDEIGLGHRVITFNSISQSQEPESNRRHIPLFQPEGRIELPTSFLP